MKNRKITLIALCLLVIGISQSNAIHLDLGPIRTKVCAFHGVAYVVITGNESLLTCPLIDNVRGGEDMIFDENSNVQTYSQTFDHGPRDDVHNEDCYSSRYMD